MAEKTSLIRLLILTPDRVALDVQVSSLRFKQPDGWKGILARHAPYLTRLADGAMIYRPVGESESPAGKDERPVGEGQPAYMVLHGGTLQVTENEVIVLTTAAEPGQTMKELASRLSERRAEADAMAFEAHIEFTRVRAALARALTNLPSPPEGIR